MTFEPGIETAPADDDPVDIKTPTGRFRFVDPKATWGVSMPALYRMQVVATEARYAA